MDVEFLHMIIRNPERNSRSDMFCCEVIWYCVYNEESSIWNLNKYKGFTIVQIAFNDFNKKNLWLWRNALLLDITICMLQLFQIKKRYWVFLNSCPRQHLDIGYQYQCLPTNNNRKSMFIKYNLVIRKCTSWIYLDT